MGKDCCTGYTCQWFLVGLCSFYYFPWYCVVCVVFQFQDKFTHRRCRRSVSSLRLDVWTVVFFFSCSTFTNHEEFDIKSSVLIAIPKPGKPKGPPNNLRPITLLNTLRKVLSLITLDRIRPSIEKYLLHSQSGFRPERSTSDVVWTHRWLAAKTVTENINIKITGIDMSAAFDTIDRDILLQILKNIVEEDELRLIQILLRNTHINTRINNADINAPFTSNVGTPQGDGLSPVLFTIYLEHALKEVRIVIGEPKSPLEEKIPREIAYADDVDFVGLEYIVIVAVQRTLHRYNL